MGKGRAREVKPNDPEVRFKGTDSVYPERMQPHEPQESLIPEDRYGNKLEDAPSQSQERDGAVMTEQPSESSQGNPQPAGNDYVGIAVSIGLCMVAGVAVWTGDGETAKIAIAGLAGFVFRKN